MNTFKKVWLALTVVVGIYAIVWGYNKSYDAGYKAGAFGMYDAGFYSGLDAASEAYEGYLAGNCSCRDR